MKNLYALALSLLVISSGAVAYKAEHKKHVDDRQTERTECDCCNKACSEDCCRRCGDDCDCCRPGLVKSVFYGLGDTVGNVLP